MSVQEVGRRHRLEVDGETCDYPQDIDIFFTNKFRISPPLKGSFLETSSATNSARIRNIEM